mmetsp:Transcript_133805/g.286178  ORF Transcript_133805/g.286178 Transcript_133805/m.286178 type:complete len:241 (+) Transcript_133805:423-1145(+)
MEHCFMQDCSVVRRPAATPRRRSASLSIQALRKISVSTLSWQRAWPAATWSRICRSSALQRSATSRTRASAITRASSVRFASTARSASSSSSRAAKRAFDSASSSATRRHTSADFSFSFCNSFSTSAVCSCSMASKARVSSMRPAHSSATSSRTVPTSFRRASMRRTLCSPCRWRSSLDFAMATTLSPAFMAETSASRSALSARKRKPVAITSRCEIAACARSRRKSQVSSWSSFSQIRS